MTPRKLPRPAAHFLALAATLALGACNCSTAVQTEKPSLTVTPTSLDFGLVAVGQASQPLVVKLQAITTAQVKISQVSVMTTAGGGNVFTIQGTPPTVVEEQAPGQITVLFTPAAATTYAGELTFQSNDANNLTVQVFLSGQGSEPEISVMPNHLGMTAVACPPGVTSTRCEASEAVTITNVGMVPLQLSAGGVYIGAASGQAAPPANLRLANQVNTQTIAPNDTLQVTVVWEPAGVIPPTPDAGVEIDAGEDAGTCVIPTDDGGTDGGESDAGPLDAGAKDAGAVDAGTDAGVADAGTSDSGSPFGEVGNFTGTLVIKSDDPSKPEVDVPIAATGLPVGPPTACVNVLSVTELEYANNPQGGAPLVSQTALVDSAWQDPMVPNLVHVRPGMTLSLTSQRVKLNSMGFPVVDTAQQASNPCTADPNGFMLTETWALTAQPSLSSASVQPTLGPTSQLTIDAAGQYTVEFYTENNLELTSPPAVLNIDAVPRDDLFAQLSWPDGPGIDLDIHLLVDQGPLVGMPPNNKHTASMFCTQDCFFYNFAPIWFTNSTGDEIPHLLRDDQGTSGQLESISLVTAPPNSVFRVAAQYYGQNGSVMSTTPQITIRHQATPYGPGGACDTTPFTPLTPLQNQNDAWFGVQVSFDANSNITVTGLTGGVVNQVGMMPIPPGSTVPPDFTQPGTNVGVCP